MAAQGAAAAAASLLKAADQRPTIPVASDQPRSAPCSTSRAPFKDGLQRSPLSINIKRWTAEFSALHAWVLRRPGSTFEQWTVAALQAEIDFLTDGLLNGFKIVDSKPPPYEINYVIDPADVPIIDADLAEELAAGRLFLSPSKPSWITPHFIKKQADNKNRIIRDFTVARAHADPAFAAVNDSTWNNTFKMMSVDDAFAEMRPRAYLAKIDISKAYRSVPVHPDHWELLSYMWRGVYYTDTRLPFGLSNAPEIFCRLTAMIRLMMARRGFSVIVYVDDFLIINVEQTEARAAYESLLSLLLDLGFTVNAKKCTPPCRDLVFLGIRLQTDVNGSGSGSMAASVPPAKLSDILDLITTCQRSTAVGIRRWQCLLGRLNFVSRVIHGARPHTRRLLDALRQAMRAGSARIAITPAIRLDFKFWLQFAEVFNGHAVILAEPVLHPGFFATDASDEGIGGFFNGACFGSTFSQLAKHATPLHLEHRDLWPPHSASAVAATKRPTCTHIGYKELFAVWWACILWSTDWAGLTIIIHVDNEGVRGMLNSGTCTSPNPSYMKLLRAIFWLSATRGFRVKATRISTVDNLLADRLSRGTQDAADFRQALAEWRQQATLQPRLLPRDHIDRLRALERLYADRLPKHGRLRLGLSYCAAA